MPPLIAGHPAALLSFTITGSSNIDPLRPSTVHDIRAGTGPGISANGGTPKMMSGTHQARRPVLFRMAEDAAISLFPERFSASALRRSVRHADAKRAERLMSRHAETFDAVSAHGRMALHEAIRRGNVQMTRLLMKNGATLDRIEPATGKTPLNLAMEHGHVELARQLIQEGVAVHQKDWRAGKAPLNLAIERGLVELAALMIDRGAPIDEIEAGTGNTPLRMAIERGQTELVELLISRGATFEGASAGASGRSMALAFALAVERGHARIVELLLKLGAVYDEIDPRTGEAPLTLAIEGGHAHLTQQLIQLTMTGSPDEQFRTQLFAALGASAEQPRFLEHVLRTGASANARDDGGRPALLQAVRRGWSASVQLLLDHGADVRHLRTSDARSILKEATESTLHTLLWDDQVQSALSDGTLSLTGWAPPDSARMTRLLRQQERAAAYNRLSQAVYSGNAAALRLALSSTDDPNIAHPVSGLTILHHATHLSADTGRESLIDVLTSDPRVHAIAIDERTPYDRVIDASRHHVASPHHITRLREIQIRTEAAAQAREQLIELNRQNLRRASLRLDIQGVTEAPTDFMASLEKLRATHGFSELSRDESDRIRDLKNRHLTSSSLPPAINGHALDTLSRLPRRMHELHPAQHLVLGAMFLATKYLDDEHLWAKDAAPMFQMTAPELNGIVDQLLGALDFEVTAGEVRPA